MTPGQRRAFPLLPRRPLVGNPFGAVPSRRRGPGTDVIGSRPYVPGDRLAAVDWKASARLSAVTGRDEFVVRETLGDDSPRVVIVCDRRPAMALYPDGLPFLSKHDAVYECVRAISASARAARASIGWCEITGAGETWLQPRNVLAQSVIERRLATAWDAPSDGLERALASVARRRSDAPPGTFLFVISDFLAPPPADVWHRALRQGLDLVPVIVQDPVWEASFPDVARVVLPIGDPAGSRGVGTRLTPAEARERRTANEERARLLRDRFRGVGVDVVSIAFAAGADIDAAFAAWAARRRRLRRARALP